MSKILKTAAIVVGAVAAVVTAIPTAGASIAAFVGVSTGALTAGLAIAGIALTVGASLLAPKPTSGGSQTAFKPDPNAGIPYAIGRTSVGGNIIYRRTYNSPGYSLPDLQAFGVILSGAGPIDAIESFQSDKPTAVYDAANNLIATTNTTVTFDGSGNAQGFFNSWMFQTTQLGATPEPRALAKTYGGTYPPDWSAASKLSGYAAAMWTLRYDQKGKVYTNNVPAPAWVIRGVKCYDARLDSTYPGGSGNCRAGVESSYVYSENPYCHALTWCLGRYQNGHRILGIGAPVMGIDVAAFVEGANVADANGWKAGGVVYSTDSKWNVLKSILQAGGGEPMHLGARISCMINTPRVVLDTVTTADITGEVTVTATQARRDRINSVTGTYRSEAHQWEVIAASPITVTDYVAVDGGLRSKKIDYVLVQNLKQMASLARYDIENAREFGPVVMPLKTRWLGYKPGDCIAVTLPESGLVAQPVIIRNRGLDPQSGTVTLTCRSETPGKHPFALGQTAIAPPTPTVTGPPLIPVPADGAWIIAAVGLTTGNSTTPALVVTGSTAGISVDGVVFEYRLFTPSMDDGAGWMVTGGADLPSTVRKEVTALLPGTAYEAAVSYQLRGTTGARRILGPVTTAGVVVDWASVTGAEKDALVAEAAAAQAAAAAAAAQLAIIASDGYLSKNEKPAVILDWVAIDNEYADIDAKAAALGIGAERTAWYNARTALDTYLAGLSPTWNDAGTDTPIIAANFKAAFANYYAARQVLLNKFVAVVNATANQAIADAAIAEAAAHAAAADAAAANAALAVIAADNVLSRGEKPAVILDWQTINNEYSIIDARAAAFGIGVERTAWYNARNALDAYLTGLSPAWNDAGLDTPINGTNFRAAFANYYQARQALEDKIALVASTRAQWDNVTGLGKDALIAQAAAAAANAAAAISALNVIASDGYLSRGEKPTVIRDFNDLNTSYNDLATRAGALGITTEVSRLYNAIVALANYLGGLTPAWSDTSQDTPINAATFAGDFNEAYAARTALLTKMAAVASTTSAWTGVSGTGKPADNADVTQTVLVAKGLPPTASFGSGATANSLHDLDPTAAAKLDAAASSVGGTAANTIRIGIGTSPAISRLIPAGAAATVTAGIGALIDASYSGTLTVQMYVNGSALGSPGSVHYGPDGPDATSISASYTNPASAGQVFDFTAVVTKTGGGAVAIDPAMSFLNA